MVDKVYVVYTNEKNARIAGIFLSKELAKAVIDNSNGEYLDIAPEEWVINKSLPYSEKDLMERARFDIAIINKIDDIDIGILSRVPMKKFTMDLNESVMDVILNALNNMGKEE